MNEIVYDDQGWHDAGLTAYIAWERYAHSKTTTDQASALVELSNALSDLFSWLPGHDIDRGGIDFKKLPHPWKEVE